MIDVADDDTTAAPTTEVPPATQAAPELAWSVDTEEMGEPSPHRGTRVTLLLGALVIVTGSIAATLALVFAFPSDTPTQTPTPTTHPARLTPSLLPPYAAPEPPAPPAPTTVTVTATPAPSTVAAQPTTTTPDLPAADANFLALLKDSTTGVTDPARAIAIGHTVCGDLTQTPSTRDYPRGVTVANTIAQLYGMDWNTADDYVEAASVAYCPDIPTTH